MKRKETAPRLLPAFFPNRETFPSRDFRDSWKAAGDPPAICSREAMKKSNLIALAKTMISTSFPALRGMTLRLKILDSDDFVMAVWIENREVHLEVSREHAARMVHSVVTGVIAHELHHP